MSLGQQISLLIGQFIIGNSFFLVLLGFVGYFGYKFYYRFFRINRDTDHIDVAKLYCQLEMKRKYKQ